MTSNPNISKSRNQNPRLTNDWEVHFEAHELQKLEPIHVRHVNIADDQIKLVLVLPQHLQCLDCLVRRCN